LREGEVSRLERFEMAVLQHLDAAYNLARWLTHDYAFAEDAVQDACVRAFRFFEGMQGPSPKAWFMAIVRNACMDCLREQKRGGSTEEFDETRHGAEDRQTSAALDSPETNALRNADTRAVHAAIAALPIEFREVIVLRELEEMSYKEISAIVTIPIGTVMSRISRGRDLLREKLAGTQLRATS
jgi:RNA polymerase sigma factor (sigma-70 family)